MLGEAMIDWDLIQKITPNFPEYWPCAKCKLQYHVTKTLISARWKGIKAVVFFVECPKCKSNLFPQKLVGKLVFDPSAIAKRGYAGL